MHLLCILGAFGRFVGNLLVSSGVSVHTGLCCVVGATAVLVGIVRVSPVAAAVIVLEATGDIAYALPLIVAALLAHVVSGVISEGMYEVEIASLQYPYLKEEWAGVSSTARVSRSARDIMSCDPVVLSTRISISRLRVFLQNNSYSLFPVGTLLMWSRLTHMLGFPFLLTSLFFLLHCTCS
mgnify:CR=1 FL=1